MTASSILRSIWRRRLIAFCLLWVVTAAGALFLSAQEEVYESEVSVALLPLPDETGSTTGSLPFYSEAVRSLLPTYAEVVESGVVLERVSAALDDGTTVEDLEDSVFVRTLPGSAVVSVVAQAGSARLSADIADLTAREFVREVREGRVLIGRTLDAAQVPTAPIAPNRPLAGAAILLLSVAVACTGALVFDRLLGRIETLQQLRESTSVPVLGGVSYDKRLRRRQPQVVVDHDAFAVLREDLREVHANLLFALRQHPRSLIAVTGLHPGDGASTVTANLAVTAAAYGRSALVVDADFSAPAQHSVFSVPLDVGLTHSEQEGVEPGDLTHPTLHPRLAVVPAGTPLADRASEVGVYLRQLPRFADLAELVLVDAPSLQSNADARMLAASAGAVLLVVKAGTTTPSRLQDAVDGLERVGVAVLGVVLAQRKRGQEWSRRSGAGGATASRQDLDGAELDQVGRRPLPRPPLKSRAGDMEGASPSSAGRIHIQR